EVGGGFGGKIQEDLEPLAALLSREAGRRVTMWMSRTEVFTGTGPGPGTYIRCTLGGKRSGVLVAAELYMVYGAGAFPGSPVGSGAVTALSSYRIPNFRVDGYDVVTNKPRVQPYRAPGAPQAAFAVETVIDEIAAAIGMDPVELRLKNAASAGDRGVHAAPSKRIGLRAVLGAVRVAPHSRAPLPPQPGTYAVGRGVAAGFWVGASLTSTVQLTFNPAGTVNLITGSVDLSGSRASLAMIVAEELGPEPHEVKPIVADTDTVGYTDGTRGQ